MFEFFDLEFDSISDFIAELKKYGETPFDIIQKGLKGEVIMDKNLFGAVCFFWGMITEQERSAEELLRATMAKPTAEA